ncbi:MAG: DUF4160 domain-containing protein [Bacillota bacterium]|jgi:transcriptional regulator with XRE-family HTH domain
MPETTFSKKLRDLRKKRKWTQDKLGEKIGVHGRSISGELFEGSLPPKTLSMAREWIAANKAALTEMWNTQEFKMLPPLE